MPLLRFRFRAGGAPGSTPRSSGLLMVGVFLGGFTEGVARAGPGPAIVMSSTSPFWVAILSRIVYGERSRGVRPRAAVGFGGVILVFSSQLGLQRRRRADVVRGLGSSPGGGTRLGDGTLVVIGAADAAARHRSPRRRRRPVPGRRRPSCRRRRSPRGPAGRWSSLTAGSRRLHLDRRLGDRHRRLLRGAARLSADAVTAWAFLSPVVAVLIGLGLGTVPAVLPCSSGWHHDRRRVHRQPAGKAA